MKNKIVIIVLFVLLIFFVNSVLYLSIANGRVAYSKPVKNINHNMLEIPDTKVSEIAIFLMSNKNMDLSESIWWSRNIINATNEINNVTPEILIALIEVESSFKIDAVSSAGAIGPTQVIPRYWSHLGDIHDPSENIIIGAKILSHYIDKCGHFKCGIMMYNIGITNYNNGKLIDRGKVYYNKISKNMMNNSFMM